MDRDERNWQQRLAGLYRSDRSAALSLVLLAFSFYAAIYFGGTLVGRSPQSDQTHYAYLAEAMLTGRLDIAPGRGEQLGEIVTFEGKRYVVYPPFPAVVLLPVVAVFGAEVATGFVSILLAALCVALMFRWLRGLGRPRDVAWWSAVVFGLGTGYAYVAVVGSSWLMAHVFGVLLLTAALAEICGKNRGLLVGLLIGAAMLCRLPIVLATPFAMALAARRRGGWLRPVSGIAAGVGLLAGLNALYNWARFGAFGNVAYTMIPGVLEEPWYDRGIFDLAYLPRNIYALLFEPPILIDSWPYIVVSLWGLGVLFATPSFALVVWAPFREATTRLCLAAALACMLPGFLHGWPGAQQYGYRFSLDAAPFLIALVALGMGERVTGRIRALVLFNVLLVSWGIATSRWILPGNWLYSFH